MKIKLDENFGFRIKNILIENGFDAETVLDEKISGIEDKKLFDICIKEQRCLLTLDLDFSDVLVYPPDKTYGIVVFRASAQLTFQLIEYLIKQFISNINISDIKGKLWIVEPNRIRIHNND